MEDKRTILVATFKHYIICKVMEVYGYVLKDNLPNSYIANKSEDVIKACKKFYTAFDKKMEDNKIEAVEDMSLEYFEAIDIMLSLPPDEFAIISAKIKEYSHKHEEVDV